MPCARHVGRACHPRDSLLGHCSRLSEVLVFVNRQQKAVHRQAASATMSVLRHIVLAAASLSVLWRVRARLLYACDIMLALARGLYGKQNIYLADGFKCGHSTVLSSFRLAFTVHR